MDITIGILFISSETGNRVGPPPYWGTETSKKIKNIQCGEGNRLTNKSFRFMCYNTWGMAVLYQVRCLFREIYFSTLNITVCGSFITYQKDIACQGCGSKIDAADSSKTRYPFRLICRSTCNLTELTWVINKVYKQQVVLSVLLNKTKHTALVETYCVLRNTFFNSVL